MKKRGKSNPFIPQIAFVILLSVIFFIYSINNQKTSNSVQAKSMPTNHTVETLPEEFHMLNGMDGYGLSSDHPIMVTTNGGNTWIDVTPLFY